MAIRLEVKRLYRPPPAESMDFGAYFEEIGLGIAEPIVEAITSPEKRKSARVEKRQVYKYPKV